MRSAKGAQFPGQRIQTELKTASKTHWSSIYTGMAMVQENKSLNIRRRVKIPRAINKNPRPSLVFGPGRITLPLAPSVQWRLSTLISQGTFQNSGKGAYQLLWGQQNFKQNIKLPLLDTVGFHIYKNGTGPYLKEKCLKVLKFCCIIHLKSQSSKQH